MEIRSDVRIYSGVFLIFLAAAAVIILMRAKSPPPAPVISSFEQCAAAGYPVMQSYPRQCTLPNGKFFVEQSAARECAADSQCPPGQTCQNHLCQ